MAFSWRIINQSLEVILRIILRMVVFRFSNPIFCSSLPYFFSNRAIFSSLVKEIAMYIETTGVFELWNNCNAVSNASSEIWGWYFRIYFSPICWSSSDFGTKSFRTTCAQNSGVSFWVWISRLKFMIVFVMILMFFDFWSIFCKKIN